MQIFTRELKTQRRPLFFWCLGMLLMIWSGMEKYSGLKLSGNAASEMLSQLPQSIRKIVGIDGLDINSIVGFYGVLYIYIAVLAAIQAVLLGASIITKEERDKTIEFLATKPISRIKIITEKLLAGFAVISILNIFTLCTTLYMVASHNGGNAETKYALLLMIAMYLIQLIFFSLGSFTAALLHNPKKASYLASGIMMMTFVLYIFMGIASNLDFLRPLSPFKYFEATNIIHTSSLSGVYIIFSGILITIFVTATYYLFNKKDLNV